MGAVECLERKAQKTGRKIVEPRPATLRPAQHPEDLAHGERRGVRDQIRLVHSGLTGQHTNKIADVKLSIPSNERRPVNAGSGKGFIAMLTKFFMFPFGYGP